MMGRLQVSRVLEAMGTFRYRSTLHGFDLFIGNGDSAEYTAPTRLTHGGGISATNRFWWLEWPSGRWRSRMVSTQRELHRLITETLAGEKPPDREGYKQFASLHTFKGNSNYVWMYLRARK